MTICNDGNNDYKDSSKTPTTPSTPQLTTPRLRVEGIEGYLEKNVFKSRKTPRPPQLEIIYKVWGF